MIFLQIPEATPTTVRAVVSTVNSGASKPHLVITETLSTIDFEVIMVVLVVVMIVVVDFWSRRLSQPLTLRWLWLDVVVFIVVAVVDRDWLNFDHLISYISEGHVVNVDHNRGDTGRTHCAFHHGVGRGRGNRVHDHQVLSLSQVLSGKIALSCFAFYVKGDSHWDWQEEAICLFSMLSFSHKPAKHTKSLKQD